MVGRIITSLDCVAEGVEWLARREPAFARALPLVAAFYTGCTLWSALDWVRGRGGMWKGRAQAGR